MANFLLDLRSNLQNNAQVQNFGKRLKDIGDKIPNLLTSLEELKEGYLERKKRVLKGLIKREGKHKLALRMLGWGTLMDLLNSAFCGDVLDVWS